MIKYNFKYIPYEDFEKNVSNLRIEDEKELVDYHKRFIQITYKGKYANQLCIYTKLRSKYKEFLLENVSKTKVLDLQPLNKYFECWLCHISGDELNEYIFAVKFNDKVVKNLVLQIIAAFFKDNECYFDIIKAFSFFKCPPSLDWDAYNQIEYNNDSLTYINLNIKHIPYITIKYHSCNNFILFDVYNSVKITKIEFKNDMVSSKNTLSSYDKQTQKKIIEMIRVCYNLETICFNNSLGPLNDEIIELLLKTIMNKKKLKSLKILDENLDLSNFLNSVHLDFDIKCTLMPIAITVKCNDNFDISYRLKKYILYNSDSDYRNDRGRECYPDLMAQTELLIANMWSQDQNEYTYNYLYESKINDFLYYKIKNLNKLLIKKLKPDSHYKKKSLIQNFRKKFNSFFNGLIPSSVNRINELNKEDAYIDYLLNPHVVYSYGFLRKLCKLSFAFCNHNKTMHVSLSPNKKCYQDMLMLIQRTVNEYADYLKNKSHLPIIMNLENFALIKKGDNAFKAFFEFLTTFFIQRAKFIDMMASSKTLIKDSCFELSPYTNRMIGIFLDLFMIEKCKDLEMMKYDVIDFLLCYFDRCCKKELMLISMYFELNSLKDVVPLVAHYAYFPAVKNNKFQKNVDNLFFEFVNNIIDFKQKNEKPFTVQDYKKLLFSNFDDNYKEEKKDEPNNPYFSKTFCKKNI